MHGAGVDALIAIGGEDTLGVAKRLTDDGIGVVGVPKTIDNDLGATDYTFGFDTAVGIATEAIDRLRTTAESHHRTLVVEVMGRHAGLDRAALRPGRRRQRDPRAGAAVRRRRRSRPGSSTASSASTRRSSSWPRAPLPAEGGEALVSGELDAFGHVRLGGIGTWLAEELERRTGHESRAVVLGHVQRGGTPTAYDRVLSTRFGLQAIDAVNDKDFGVMVALRGTDIVRVPLSEATAELKTVPAERLRRGRGLLRLSRARARRRCPDGGIFALMSRRASTLVR